MPCRASATQKPQESVEQCTDEFTLQRRSCPETLGLFYDKDFRSKEFIGNGFFSSVYKVTLEDNRIFALKVNLKQENRANCLREIQLLKKLSHENILGYRGVYFDEGNFHPLVEFINGGTLAELIAASEGREVDLELKWLIIDHTSKGLDYLHEMDIFHRDLASKNVLLETEVDGKVARAIVGDFGLADYLPQYKGQQQLAAVGSPFWMAPECLMANGDFYYDHKVDVFSYGIVLCELMAQVDADPDILPRRNDFGIDWDQFMPKLNRYKCPVGIVEVISRCTDMNPAARPDFHEIVRDLEDYRKTHSAVITNGAIETHNASNPQEIATEGDNNGLVTRVSNPFRSNSVSLPFKEGDVRYKLIDKPDESEIYAAMDPEMSEAVKHAFAKWQDDISLGSSNNSKVRSGTMPDVSSIHKSGLHSLPCRLREKDFHQKKLSFPAALLGDISSSPQLVEEECFDNDGDQIFSGSLDNTKPSASGLFDRRRRSGMDDTNKYSNSNETKKCSNEENRFSKLSSGDSGLSSLAAVSDRIESPSYSSTSIALIPVDEKHALTSTTLETEAEKLRASATSYFTPSNIILSIQHTSKTSTIEQTYSDEEDVIRNSLCSQVDEMFNFLSVSDPEFDLENDQNDKHLTGANNYNDSKSFNHDTTLHDVVINEGTREIIHKDTMQAEECVLTEQPQKVGRDSARKGVENLGINIETLDGDKKKSSCSPPSSSDRYDVLHNDTNYGEMSNDSSSCGKMLHGKSFSSSTDKDASIKEGEDGKDSEHQCRRQICPQCTICTIS